MSLPLFLRVKPLIKLNLQFRSISVSRSNSAINNRLRRIGSSTEKERALMLQDNVPESYTLIYRAPMERMITVAKHVTTISAVVVASLAAYKASSDLNLLPMANAAASPFAGLMADVDDIWFFAAGFVTISLAIRLLIAKFPLRIYKQTDNYVAIFESQLSTRGTQHHFKKGDVAEVRQHFNPWSNALFRLGNKRCLILFDYFKTPAEFHQMCGLS